MSKLGLIGKGILDHYPSGFFSLDQIVEVTKFPRKLVSDTLFILSREGLIKKIKKQRKEHIPGHSPRFSLTYTANRKALAARIGPRLKEKTFQDRIWRLIRAKRQFNLRDLIILAGAKRGMVRWYLKALRGMGIIRPSRTGGGPEVEWTLIDDIGPKRPYIETRKKDKGREMREKTVPQMDAVNRRVSMKVRMSEEEVAMVKRQASVHNLCGSAYIRMLIHKAI
jgi:hypothetical protein